MVAKKKMIFKDQYGNKLYRVYVKSRHVYQWSAKNAQGKTVNGQGVRILMRRAGMRV